MPGLRASYCDRAGGLVESGEESGVRVYVVLGAAPVVAARRQTGEGPAAAAALLLSRAECTKFF